MHREHRYTNYRVLEQALIKFGGTGKLQRQSIVSPQPCKQAKFY